MGSVTCLILCVMALSGQSVNAGSSQEQQKRAFEPDSYSLRIENDSLPGAASDQNYTHGTEVRVATPWKWPWLAKPGWAHSLAVGQTMFTPQNLLTHAPSPRDRPFAAYLWVGLESSRVHGNGDRRREVVTVNVGSLGPPSLGRFAQSGLHVIRESRLVKGWRAQQVSLGFPLLMVRGTAEQIASRGRVIGIEMDLTPALEASVGAPQTHVGAGATMRIGRGLSGFPVGIIPPAALARAVSKPRTRVELALRVGGRVRAFAYNAFIQGPRTTSPTASECASGECLNAERVVADVLIGADARLNAWKLSYSVVWRSREFQPVGVPLPEVVPDWHRFVAVTLAHEGWQAGAPGEIECLFGGTRIGLRFGAPLGLPALPSGADAPQSLASAFSLERELPWWRLAIGVETFGAGKEALPTTQRQEDLLLLAKTVWIGRDLLSTESRHAIQLRAGLGRGVAKTQRYIDEGALVEPGCPPSGGVCSLRNDSEHGAAVAAGVRYSFQLFKPVSLVVDLAAANLSFELDKHSAAGTFHAATIGVVLHPWGRNPRFGSSASVSSGSQK